VAIIVEITIIAAAIFATLLWLVGTIASIFAGNYEADGEE
jgi:hypothetical protein